MKAVVIFLLIISVFGLDPLVVKYEEDGFVGIVTINRPKALNALNSKVLEALESTFKSIDINKIRAVILTGEGKKSFVAGADIGEMSTLTKAQGEAMYSE